ncbi:hypothetical protein [Streptomyces sp. NPDC059743]|uniref:hypothetical protein n=1 Tax=Streptomyces sp. NPDC059743 TaxID=3346928 RepID=UPI0036638EDC
MSIVVSVTVIAVGVLYASMATADPLDPLELPVPVDTEEGFTYTCHCYRDPVRVTIR